MSHSEPKSKRGSGKSTARRTSRGEKTSKKNKRGQKVLDKMDPQDMLAMLERQATLDSEGAEGLFDMIKTSPSRNRSLDQSDHVATPRAA